MNKISFIMKICLKNMPSELQEMLGIGRNKAYKLLKTSQIYNKRIGNNYYIPKYSVIEYILKK